jgi:multicomponent Na+:H+ antiporter subunit F
MNGLDLVFFVSLPIMTVAFVLAFVRLVRGPTLPDRVVALDFMAAVGIGFVAAYAVYTEEKVLLDVATVVALISFLATVAFAYYVQREG